MFCTSSTPPWGFLKKRWLLSRKTLMRWTLRRRPDVDDDTRRVSVVGVHLHGIKGDDLGVVGEDDPGQSIEDRARELVDVGLRSGAARSSGAQRAFVSSCPEVTLRPL